MAEIKSTLDLVMEKTKGLVQSEEEKKEIQAQERRNRARSLLLQLKEGRIKPDKLAGALAQWGEEEAAFIKPVFFKLLLESIALGEDNSVFLDGIKALSASPGDDAAKDIEAILKEYDRSIIDLAFIYRKKLLQELESRGISGSAVVPKVDRDPAWAKARKEIRDRFEARLNRARALLVEKIQPA